MLTVRRAAEWLAILSLGACGGGASSAGQSSAAATTAGRPGGGLGTVHAATTYPKPSTNPSDLIGVYSWGTDFDAYMPGTVDRLTWSAEKVSGLGSRVIRVYLGASDPYDVIPPAASTLTAEASSSAYQALFQNPQFDTYLLTTYSAADAVGGWLTGLTAAEGAAETSEIAQLTEYLSTTYPTKTFILLNWEGDNAVAYGSNRTIALQGFTDWMNARAAGVVEGRASSHHDNVYSGLEFNLVRNPANGAPCDTGANPCVISVAAPHVDVDYYSYSSYQSNGVGTAVSQIPAQMTTDMNAALGWIKAGQPSVTQNRMLIGEFGFAREDWDESEAADRASEMIQFATTWGVRFAIYWQIIDNALNDAALSFGFGLYKRDGSISQAGDLFQSYYSTGTLPPASTTCPTVAGVVNGVTYNSDFTPTTVATLFGSFDASNNTVTFRQGTTEWEVTAANGVYWYESPTQINVQLPPGAPQDATFSIFVTSHGLDSNAEYFTIDPGVISCGNGTCEAGETDATCPVDCCGPATPCDTVRAGITGANTEYCRAMSFQGLGTDYEWITIATAHTYCEAASQVCQSTYQCGGTNGICQSFPDGWAEEPTSCP